MIRFQLPQISETVGRKNGFSFLRFLFAFSIFISHFGVITGHSIGWWPITGAMRVNGFFIISGFLITRSFSQSKRLEDYVSRRIRRVAPAYVLVVLICAFSFSLISNLSLSDYFSSKDFIKYLSANLISLNFIQPTLPGVFTENPFPFVNGSLWTIKIELAFYAFVPIMAWILQKKPTVKPIYYFVGFYLFSFLFRLLMNELYERTGDNLYMILHKQSLGQIQYFVSGMILLLYFDEIQAQRKWILSLSITIFILRYFITHWIIDLFFPFAFAVVIIEFVYYFKNLSNVTKYGDISYGVYLFHYPVIQILTSISYFKTKPILLFCISLIIVTLIAFSVWHLIEKRFIKKSRLSDKSKK